MKQTLQYINSLIDEGIILKYAIGGGIASLYYLEPTTTYDLDIMVILAFEENIFTPLKPIYEWAKKHDFSVEDEYIFIDSVPVQFLPVYKDLVKEAVENSLKINLYDVETYVIGPEYLVAIMLDTGRAKDKLRALQFYQEVQLDKDFLNKLLERYSLKVKLESLLQQS
ncbi:MAG: hypothetical protein Q8858_13630 [Bacteroidota bacterium]|nr:hypothetical protein [Bacteroidota bacterium]MDP4197451.1 hypothetical protein [Bacteroidota bacterium]